MEGREKRLRRQSDPVTWTAVVLFVTVIVMELALASWLPRRLRTERLWGREMAMQELIEQVDWLRSHLRDRKYENRWRRGEAELAMTCIDDIARYVREHQAAMTDAQVNLLRQDLAFFESAYLVWKGGKQHFVVEEMQTDPWLERQRRRLAAVVATEGSP